MPVASSRTPRTSTSTTATSSSTRTGLTTPTTTMVPRPASSRYVYHPHPSPLPSRERVVILWYGFYPAAYHFTNFHNFFFKLKIFFIFQDFYIIGQSSEYF